MIHVSTAELAELTRALTLLEGILEKLDDLGAGIAAIHVDAAICQLKSNLECVTDSVPALDIEGIQCPSECTPRSC